MRKVIIRVLLALLCVPVAGVPPARAQWAVVDAPAIVQLIQEVTTLQQSLAVARSQLQQAQATLQSTTGLRGMQALLGGTQRNYLPGNWGQVTGALQGGAGYSVLSGEVIAAVSANAVLSPQHLSQLDPAQQQQILAARQWNAMQQALSHEALANASGRFASIQNLINAMSSAGDQKAILDLQARISAEQAMLQNEQTKLQVLHQATQAQMAALAQQSSEQLIAAHGRFESRFQPAP